MSSLIVEVCTVDKIERHPMADRLALCTVKGWVTCVRFNPETGESEFKVGEKCIFFPPDSVIPESLANKPDDPIPGRLGIMNYLSVLPKDANGNRPGGGRVRATRLRGQQSFGFIMKIEPSKGDNPDWKVGEDVKEHFGVTKWEPPVESNEGDSESPHQFFYKYTDIEHYGNYPNALIDGEEVVFTEKIHGCLEENTKIMLANGEEIKISEVESGMFVISWDEKQSKFVNSEVKKVIKKTATESWIKLYFENNVLICTKDHLILTINRGWIEAENLTFDDEIKDFL